MNTIKHFSFDLWLTLIKSNPDFKKERTLWFFKHLNTKKKSLPEVERVFQRVGTMCNAINEKTGKSIESEAMYLMVIHELNEGSAVFDQVDVSALYGEIEHLFFTHIPLVYSAETLESLDKLKQGEDVSMNILSNTAFIKGRTLRTALDYLDISKYFDFQLYSDEEKLSKPNPLLFHEMVKTISSFRANKPLESNSIIHIGDNPVADIKGAGAIGIRTLQINSNTNTIKSLFSQ